MDSNINLKRGTTIYDRVKNVDGTRTIWCSKTVVFNIYNNAIEFVGTGQSTCAKDDTYNESFGKALAWIRASKNIGNQVENYLIKYSCQRTDNKIGDIECKLTLNTKSFDNNLGKLSKDVDKLISKLEEANNKVNCKIFGEDIYRYVEPKLKSYSLKDLVGKWAIRTKPVTYDNGHEDKSWMRNPLFVIKIDNNIGIEFCDNFKHDFTDTHYFYYNRENDRKWLDNNWIEYKKEPKTTTLDKLVGKWAIRIKKCGTDGSFMSEPIKIVGFYDTYVEYVMQGFLYTDIHGLSGDWLDNNWKEYDGKRGLN